MEKELINPILLWIKNRIERNKNAIIIINGPTGSGKTYAALDLGYKCAKMFETHFSIETNVGFRFEELLEKTLLPENTKPGTPFIFEEVGAFGGGAAARSWQSKANQFFFSFMQTTRHRQQILIMTCPHFSFLERGARSLVHMQMEMDHINFSNSTSVLRPYRVQVNNRTGKFYFKYLRVKKGGKTLKFNRLILNMPTKSLVDPYEVVKNRYTTELNRKIIKEQKKGNKRKDIYINKDSFINMRNEGLSLQQIADKLNVSKSTCYKTLEKIKNDPLLAKNLQISQEN